MVFSGGAAIISDFSQASKNSGCKVEIARVPSGWEKSTSRWMEA